MRRRPSSPPPQNSSRRPSASAPADSASWPARSPVQPRQPPERNQSESRRQPTRISFPSPYLESLRHISHSVDRCSLKQFVIPWIDALPSNLSFRGSMRAPAILSFRGSMLSEEL